MFNKELKEEILELKKRVWILENPPKFEIGDKVKVYRDYTFREHDVFIIIDIKLNNFAYCYKYEVISNDYKIRKFVSDFFMVKVKK